MSQPTPNITTLLESAYADGALSDAALQTLTIHADMGAQMQAGMGLAPDDVPCAEVVLVTMMPDDSGSIAYANHTTTVCEGHNQVLQALAQCTQRDDMLVHTRYLNGHVLFPYCRLPEAVPMNSKNYTADKGTPLYDQTAVVLGTVLAKTWEFQDSGVPVRTVTLIITDGADEGSTHQTPATIRALVEDMLRSEAHIIAGLGIDDGQTDFRQVFREMGLRDAWILTPRHTARDIRAAFRVFSQSAVRVSQSAAAFGQATLGGFGA